jgi:DNA-binding NarL/FixJ family response regulator
MERARVLLADDHPSVAQRLKELLAEDFTLVGVVADGVELVDAARRLNPDVIVADISMPGVDGFAALRQIRLFRPDARVILSTNYADPDLAQAAINAGASGFVLKVYAPVELVEAIGAVLAGETYVSASLASRMAQELPP